MVEKVEFEDKFELHTRERFYIENNECVNKVIPTRTTKEYREDNKEEIAVKKKQYREDNKEEIAVQRKQYREDNKEEILVRNKQYREDNKDKIAIKKKEKITCECGCIVVKNSMTCHRKTEKHKRLLASATTQ